MARLRTAPAPSQPAASRHGGSAGPWPLAAAHHLLPGGRSHADRLRAAARAGFEAVEVTAPPDPDEAGELGEASAATGVRIHSVEALGLWEQPLSSPDRADVDAAVAAIRTALEHAHRWGADTVLAYPGVVDARTSYRDAYDRSQRVLRDEVLPIAADLGVVVAIENLRFNGLLTSPLDLVRYVDELESPWVRVYLDVGNMVHGHPEHWIRAAGARTVKLHLKDFSIDRDQGRFGGRPLGEGDVDLHAVRGALVDVGFTGVVTCTDEPGGAQRWLTRGRNVASRPPMSRVPGSSLLARSCTAMHRAASTHRLGRIAARGRAFVDGTRVGG